MELEDFTIDQLAKALGGRAVLFSDANRTLTYNHLCEVDKVVESSVVVIFGRTFVNELPEIKKGCVVISPEHEALVCTESIVVENPRLAMAKLLELFDPQPEIVPGIHSSAVVTDLASVAKSAQIGPNVVIEKGAEIGEGCVIGAGCYLGEGVSIGAHTELRQNVVLAAGVRVGDRCLIHAGVVIGADGFGFEKCQKTNQWLKLRHIGSVKIGSDVEIGANTAIDRGTLGDTVIASRVKIDNHCQIGHNVQIGEATIVSGFTGIGGSTVIGSNVILAAHVIVVDHLTIADHVVVKGSSTVLRSIQRPGEYSSGLSVVPDKNWARCRVLLLKLPEILKRIQKLEKINVSVD